MSQIIVAFFIENKEDRWNDKVVRSYFSPSSTTSSNVARSCHYWCGDSFSFPCVLSSSRDPLGNKTIRNYWCYRSREQFGGNSGTDTGHCSDRTAAKSQLRYFGSYIY